MSAKEDYLAENQIAPVSLRSTCKKDFSVCLVLCGTDIEAQINLGDNHTNCVQLVCAVCIEYLKSRCRMPTMPE